MSSYVRPRIDAPVFRDADGEVIDYGRRWQGLPPSETYSVDTHPERFAPLHTVADALITYLVATYDVRVFDSVDAAADLLRPNGEIVRAVRLQPSDSGCAAITFVYTSYPGILMHAGLLHDFFYPSCGCDACDSSWESEADELERQIFAVVGGRYRESIDGGLRPRVEFALTYPDGSTSGRVRAAELPADRVKAAKPILRIRPDGWAPWPRVADIS